MFAVWRETSLWPETYRFVWKCSRDWVSPSWWRWSHPDGSKPPHIVILQFFFSSNLYPKRMMIRQPSSFFGGEVQKMGCHQKQDLFKVNAGHILWTALGINKQIAPGNSDFKVFSTCFRRCVWTCLNKNKDLPNTQLVWSIYLHEWLGFMVFM